jgi:hypothetical protein
VQVEKVRPGVEAAADGIMFLRQGSAREAEPCHDYSLLLCLQMATAFEVFEA